MITVASDTDIYSEEKVKHRSLHLYSAIVLIIILAISLRAFFLIRGKFLTVGTMAAVLAMKQTIANGYVIHPNPLASFPNHPYIFPETGLIYFAVYTYRIFPFIGIFGSMYLIKTLFTILGVITVFLFAKKITKNAEAGLLASLLYATSEIGITAEAFNRWKGDSFVPILLLFSVLMLLHLIENKNHYNSFKKIGFFLLITVPLVFSYYIWNGGLYATAAFFFILTALIISNIIPDTKKQALAIILIFAAAWTAFVFFHLNNAISLGPINLTPHLFIEDILQLLGQLESAYYLPSLIYHTYLYYIWVLAGFLSTFGLLIITIRLYKPSLKDKNQKSAYTAILAMLLFGIPFAIIQYRFNSLVYLPISIIAGCSIALIPDIWKRNMKIFIPSIITIVLIFAIYQIISTPQYTGMSQQFHRELYWIVNNTPKNATFLNFDGDGTAIQYWANRTTYSDTNYADNQTVVNDYYSFLYARAGNFSYLNQIKPDYLLIHQVPSINNDYNRSFNGSNIQYLIEWTRSPHPNFYYDGVLFNLVYANFTPEYINNGTILFRLFYMNESEVAKLLKVNNKNYT